MEYGFHAITAEVVRGIGGIGEWPSTPGTNRGPDAGQLLDTCRAPEARGARVYFSTSRAALGKAEVNECGADQFEAFRDFGKNAWQGPCLPRKTAFGMLRPE